jgi:2-polyprenyl-3-methyl-5-hydroxy-6-metoxy-1,4-benzoquinol methylase
MWDGEESFGERWDVFCALPQDPGSILDVGCGVGLGFQTFKRRGVRVVGIDNDPNAVRQAAENLSEAVLLDVERDPWPESFLGAFDVVAFCDALEHLVDPWAALGKVRALLTEQGVVVASIPNVRQVRVVAKLALGRWDYVKGAGTVQRGHLRFFTRRTITDMFDEAGYEGVKFFFPRQTFHLRRPERLLNSITVGRFADLLYGSYTLSARPRP